MGYSRENKRQNQALQSILDGGSPEKRIFVAQGDLEFKNKLKEEADKEQKRIDEKFEVNTANGTSSLSLGFPISPGRNGFNPTLGLSYNSGSGNSEFGLGWSIGMSSISLKTQLGIPKYQDDEDTYQLTGVEDLVPYLNETSPGVWESEETT